MKHFEAGDKQRMVSGQYVDKLSFFSIRKIRPQTGAHSSSAYTDFYKLSKFMILQQINQLSTVPASLY
jgi:hypothetical protein